jgi:hypothetical protein
MSFAFSVVDGSYINAKDDRGDGADGSYYELRELELYEVSIVPIGANQETEILAVKTLAGSLRAKAGRMLSSRNETALRDVLSDLKASVAALETVLPEDDSADEEDQEQTSEEEPPPEGQTASAEKSSPTVPATPTPSVSLAMAMIAIESQGEIPL